ncbi:unnamed protein product [Rotaria magnacalcarata]|uniref:Uncharacterized protein n=1 Tax=Rotaria magnacalcarata TaxID=392030 RepID=A0A816QP80_9BILA|nr:unnamed protein product [Rotaria magnacalcarata]CAF2064102.1 unnamed protein product [Rotaria magnacalcarata]CAF4037932.1 unnamed protein product [Rotaria magnacalcarata]
MSATSSTDSIPTAYQYANPLLYTLRDYNMSIDPYWIVFLRFLSLQFSLRLWTRVFYGGWLTPVEFIVDASEHESQHKPSTIEIVSMEHLGRRPSPTISTVYILQDFKKKKKEKKKKQPTFDLFDAVFYCIPLLGHAGWYCYIQSSSMSATYGTTWNCYNAFGYRLYNYLFEQYANFAVGYLTKLFFLKYGNKKEEGEKKEQVPKDLLSFCILSKRIYFNSYTCFHWKFSCYVLFYKCYTYDMHVFIHICDLYHQLAAGSDQELTALELFRRKYRHPLKTYLLSIQLFIYI